MSYNIPITLFRDLPVYSGALPPDGVQLVVVAGNNGLYRAGLSSILEGTATVAEGVPAYPGDTLSGELAWEDGAFYVNTESGWEKMAVYSEHWDDIVPGTRFLRVDAPMSLSASEIGNALVSLDITEATPSHMGLVYIAESIDDLNKVATAGLVKSYVATFSGRIEEVYTYVQEAATEIAGDLAIVDAALEEIRDIGSGVESAKSYVDDVKDDVDLLASSAASSAGRAEMAAERAEQASGALPGFDEIPTADSRNVVRSGGIKLWGDTSFVPLSHVEDIGTGYSEPHVSDDDRERWDAAAGGTIPDRYMEVLASLADDGAITGPDIKIGVSEDDTIIWARDIGVDGKTALTLTSDSLSVVAGDGAGITGDTHIEGDLDVSGTVTSGGHAVVTVNDAGAFPTGGSLVDGYAGVADAVEYIAIVETSIKDYVAANYSRVPVEGGYAERAGDNTMTGSNVFTGEVMFTGPVSVDGNVLSCGGGLSVDGGDIDLGTGWSINAPDANIATISADLVDIGTGGSLRVDGDTNVVDIGIGGDARIHGTAVVDGTLTVGGDFSVDGITTFGDIIDSDVIIGHGPIGKVRAQADLHIGDPSAPGTIRYNNYTYTVDAGVPTQATGQVELVNPMVPCLITIGDNDPLYIEPERASLGATYSSLESGTGTDTGTDTGSSTYKADPPLVHPLTPQQIADLISTLPDYTASVHETGSNLVDITAKLPGAMFNADTYAVGGVDVVTPVSGGADDRDAGGLAALLSAVGIFDVRAAALYPGVIELTAKQAGGYNNDKPIECTGCFGTGTVLMGSKTAGADGVDPTHYNLMLNGEYIGSGGGEFDGHLEADLVIGHGVEYAAFAVCELTPGSLRTGGTLADSNGQGVVLGIPVERATGHVDIGDILSAGSIKFGEHDAIEFDSEGAQDAKAVFTPLDEYESSMPYEFGVYEDGVEVNSWAWNAQDGDTVQELLDALNDDSGRYWYNARDIEATLEGGKVVLRRMGVHGAASNGYSVEPYAMTPFVETAETPIAGGVDGPVKASGVFYTVGIGPLDVDGKEVQIPYDTSNAGAWTAAFAAADCGIVCTGADSHGEVDVSVEAVEPGAAGNDIVIESAGYPPVQLSGGADGVTRASGSATIAVRSSYSGCAVVVYKNGSSVATYMITGTRSTLQSIVEAANARAAITKYITLSSEGQELTATATSPGSSGNELKVMLGWMVAPTAQYNIQLSGGIGTARTPQDIVDSINNSSSGYAAAVLDSSGQGIDFTAVDKGVEDRIYIEGGLFANATGMSGSSSAYTLEDLVDAIADNFDDVTPSVSESGTMIRMTAKEPGSAANYIMYMATGCFGNGVTRQGSVEEGRDAMEPTTYKIYLNGRDILSTYPTPEPTIPDVLLHNHVYYQPGDSLDLSSVSVETYAVCELVVDGAVPSGFTWPASWWWIDMFSDDGVSRTPPEGCCSEDGRRYVIALRNDGSAVLASLSYSYRIPA